MRLVNASRPTLSHRMTVTTESTSPQITQKQRDPVTARILSAYFALYHELGWGFLETVYRRAMVVGLQRLGASVRQEVRIPVRYLGAHVGDRTRAFLRLGARVVAVEPQPVCADFLERWYRKDRRVTLVRAALGAVEGKGVLRLSDRTPTVVCRAVPPSRPSMASNPSGQPG